MSQLCANDRRHQPLRILSAAFSYLIRYKRNMSQIYFSWSPHEVSVDFKAVTRYKPVFECFSCDELTMTNATFILEFHEDISVQPVQGEQSVIPTPSSLCKGKHTLQASRKWGRENTLLSNLSKQHLVFKYRNQQKNYFLPKCSQLNALQKMQITAPYLYQNHCFFNQEFLPIK